MARIEHRRTVRREPAAIPRAGGTPDPGDLADESAPEPKAPDAALDRLSWLGWVSAAVALGWLVIQLRPLLDAGALADASRLATFVAVVGAVAGAAALALPAGLELGARSAWQRVPWLYRAAILLAVAQVASIVLQQARQRFLGDLDVTDLTQPVVIAYAVASLAPPIAAIGGLWALSDALWDIGTRARPAAIRGIGLVIAWIVFLTYVPYLGQLFSTDAPVLSVLNALRLVIAVGLLAITAMTGVHLISASQSRLAPHRAWAVAGLAGASYFFGALGRTLTQIQLSQELGLPLAYAVFVIESAAPVLLLVAFALGIARAGAVREPRRRLIARWVRYSPA
jgi:hypothetical protein